MALQYRRGSASIQEAATKKTGGNFRPFIPQIQWREDGESKYVLVLTDMEEVTELLLHSFVPIGKGVKANGEEFVRYEDFNSRKMEAIGEDYDDLEDRLQREPKIRHMGVMVELEPVMDSRSKKLKSFVVKTETFTRKTDDGEVEATAPVIGLCTQSAQLMWGPLNNLFHQIGNLVDIPLSITRHGTKTNTRYDTIPFLEKAVDLSPILDHLEDIGYLRDNLEEVEQLIAAEDNTVSQAQAVASFLLNKRLEELSDGERYKELVEPLELKDMPKNPWGRKNSRPVRRRPEVKVAIAPAGEELQNPDEEQGLGEPSKNDKFAELKRRVEEAG